MSVSVTVSYKSTEEHAYAPIASEQTFITYWRPICERLNLASVLRFHGYWWVLHGSDDVSEIDTILDNLATLKEYLVGEGRKDLPAKLSDEMIARIDYLVPILQRARDHWDDVEDIVFG